MLTDESIKRVNAARSALGVRNTGNIEKRSVALAGLAVMLVAVEAAEAELPTKSGVPNWVEQSDGSLKLQL